MTDNNCPESNCPQTDKDKPKTKKNKRQVAKHWIGTVPKNSENAKFWENKNTLEHIAYIKLQEEKGHDETHYEHYQVYMCLKQKKTLSWIKKHIHKTAHWEVKRGTVAEAIDYVSKEDTRVPNGIQFEFGERPKEQSELATETVKLNRIREKDEVQFQAQDILEKINDGEFIAWRQIPVDVQMKPGFLQAYNKATRDMVGPERPNLKIITIIGPPGCGKSYAIAKLFPKAGRWLKGNNGHWFCNTKSNVMVFEEFSGQVELQSMLKYLDPYPLALEVKGGTEPAMYNLCIITSNTHPKDWYTTADEYRKSPDETTITSAKRRRTDALAALWDRLGYKKISRTCGSLYFYSIDETEQLFPIDQQIEQIRHEIWDILSNAKKELDELERKTRVEEIDGKEKQPDPQPMIIDETEQQVSEYQKELDKLDKLSAAADALNMDDVCIHPNQLYEHEDLPDQSASSIDIGLSDHSDESDEEDHINTPTLPLSQY